MNASKKEKRLSREELWKYSRQQKLEGRIFMGEEEKLIELNLSVICSEDSQLEKIFQRLVEQKKLVFELRKSSVGPLRSFAVSGQIGLGAIFDLEGQESLFSAVNGTENP